MKSLGQGKLEKNIQLKVWVSEKFGSLLGTSHNAMMSFCYVGLILGYSEGLPDFGSLQALF